MFTKNTTPFAIVPALEVMTNLMFAVAPHTNIIKKNNKLMVFLFYFYLYDLEQYIKLK